MRRFVNWATFGLLDHLAARRAVRRLRRNLPTAEERRAQELREQIEASRLRAEEACARLEEACERAERVSDATMEVCRP